MMIEMRDATLSELERLAAATHATEVPLQMDEEAFRAFYDRTARGLWAYLSRVTGDRSLADDLTQEAYYRFLRAARSYESEAHRRNSLFQIATNLARDSRRRATLLPLTGEPETLPAGSDEVTRAERRLAVLGGLARLKPRERQLLWLAYAQGHSHREIAQTLGLKTASIKLLLFRARRRLAELLRGVR